MKPNYHDIVVDTQSWNLYGDSLVIDNSYSYKIIKLDDDILIVKGFQRKWGKDTLVFNKSLEQNSIIINDPNYVSPKRIKVVHH